MRSQLGDKVRLKAGQHAGERGLIDAMEGDKLVVRLEGSNLALRVPRDGVTNFSLAARKAWVTGPDRAVGRRKGTKLCDRISVTLRIDRDLWELFRSREEDGSIADRTATINGWLRERLAELEWGSVETHAKAND